LARLITPWASASIRTPARTGAGGRVGSVRAVHVTASARTSRSTLNFMPLHLLLFLGCREKPYASHGPGGTREQGLWMDIEPWLVLVFEQSGATRRPA